MVRDAVEWSLGPSEVMQPDLWTAAILGAKLGHESFSVGLQAIYDTQSDCSRYRVDDRVTDRVALDAKKQKQQQSW